MSERPEYVYVAYNTKQRYFAMGSVSHSPQRVRDFMAADKAEWQRDRQTRPIAQAWAPPARSRA